MARQKPSWAPRGLSRSAAAHYIDVSPSTFDRMVCLGTMPKGRRLPNCRRTLWDRRQIDMALDAIFNDHSEPAYAMGAAPEFAV